MTNPDVSLRLDPEPPQIPNPGQAQMIVPMGFAAQLRALQEVQQAQTERIANLEQENAHLKDFKKSMIDIADRIRVLEQHKAYISARRREAVAQLGNMRTLHQEADNAFQLRTCDMQPDDLEGMLGVYGTMLTTAMNHHQCVLGQMRANGHFPAYTTPVPQTQQSVAVPTQYRHAYPAAYSEYGYCYAHNMPYCCRICSK